MEQDGLVQFYWDKIWELWNHRNDPKVMNQILDYITRIEIYSDNPAIKAELERTKIILDNEAQMNNFSGSTLPKNHVEDQSKLKVGEDVPIKLEELLLVEKPDVSFSKIGGLMDVKETLKMEIIYPRLYPEKYKLYGRTPGNGLLLWGPPGVGKTLLAKAVAKESGEAVFISPKVSDIMDRWVGQSEKIVAAIFSYARKFPKATLFLDEVDYIAPRSGPSYMMRIKRELLQQMDGVASKKDGLLILGASNRPWLLDPAIRRPSPEGLRFSKIILVPPPDLEARKQIFQIHLAKIPQDMIDKDVDLNELATLTHGFSGADLGAIVEEAIDIPLKQHIKGAPPRPVCMDDFRQTISSRPKSIIPWIADALKSVQRYEESYLAEQLTKLVNEYTCNEDGCNANSF
jgi:transitional endoplasmic reticulum ATPase